MNQARREMIMWSAADPGESQEDKGESVEKAAYFHTQKFFNFHQHWSFQHIAFFFRENLADNYVISND